MNKIKIVILDDHKLFRDGIKALVEMEEDMIITGEAATENELMNIFTADLPDILLLDIGLPGCSGVDILKKIVNQYPSVKVVVLSAVTDEETIGCIYESGAKTFLPKEISVKELIRAMHEIYCDREYLCDSVSSTVYRNYLKLIKARKQPDVSNILSEREMEILKLIAECLSYKEIGSKFFISERTVEAHKTNILSKLHLKTKVDLVKFAIKNKIISL